MPEGHLLHHHARRHRAALLGAERISSPQGRFPAARVSGRLEEVSVHGKHLFHHWSGGAIVHVHLGKRGLFLEGEPPVPGPRPQVRMRVEAAALISDLIAPRTCEIIDLEGREAVIARLGVDPLADDPRPGPALRELGSSGRAIGVLLLEQSIIAGVGNALRADVLNLVGIHPRVPGDQLSSDELEALWTCLRHVMERSAEAGRIEHTVYRQERCTRCGTPVRTEEIGGRTGYWCPRHQREPGRIDG